VIRVALAVAVLAVVAVACSDTPGSGGCTHDQDGVSGGTYTFHLKVSDSAFTPAILSAQNHAQVTLELENTGTKPHDFVVDCLPTPNSNGCATESCFPDGGAIPAVAPGAHATTTFVTPPDGLYAFRSGVAGDSHVGADGGVTGLAGQFNVQ
jgi:hypothetical protein